MYNVNINRTVVSSKVLFGKKGFKYFIGYENVYEKIMPLSTIFRKMGASRRDFDETKKIKR